MVKVKRRCGRSQKLSKQNCEEEREMKKHIEHAGAVKKELRKRICKLASSERMRRNSSCAPST
jgi:hypothetical protein